MAALLVRRVRLEQPLLQWGKPWRAASGVAEGGQTPFLSFAWSARSDVVAALGAEELQQSGSEAPWVDQLHGLAKLALQFWPRDAPHWRVAGPLVLPPPSSGSQGLGQHLANRLSPSGRATCIQALCACRGGPSFERRTRPLVDALVAGGSVSNSRGGLAMQLSLEELEGCLQALANSAFATLREETYTWTFAHQAARRFSERLALQDLSLSSLHTLQSALGKLGVDRGQVDLELRKRLRDLKAPLARPSDLLAVVAAACNLKEAGTLRAPALRRALLPSSLKPTVATELLPLVAATGVAEGALGKAYDFILDRACQTIVDGRPRLGVRQLGKAIEGIIALQSRGDDYATRQSSLLLRALWPQVKAKLQHFGPSELAAALKGYLWQMSYNQQDVSLSGDDSKTKSPVVETILDATQSFRQTLTKDEQAAEEIRLNLLRPALARLSEMPLREVATCLSAVAPQLSTNDLMGDEDRALLQQQVGLVFSNVCGAEDAQEQLGTKMAAWRDEYWSGEVQSLKVTELLELACGVKESGAACDWVLKSLLQELQKRLKPSGRPPPPVELSHLLLLRLCRTMDIWQGHEVEELLRQLLSYPESVRPLPTSYFVEMLGALCSLPVPKELPLRLVASLLDGVELGQRTALPAQWVDLLCFIRPLDETPSWERIVPRIIQNLVPHIHTLPPSALANLLRSLSEKPYPADPSTQSDDWSATARAPSVVTAAVREAVEAGQWNLAEVVDVFSSLGRLGWYDEAAVAAILAQCEQTPLLEPHAPLILPFMQACASLRVHHAPLLHKMVLWYCWCDAYLRPKPLPSDMLDELLAVAGHLLELSFQSLEMHRVLAENLKNPQASLRQQLVLLATLARSSHFPPEFKETCATVCTNSSDTSLSSLSSMDLVDAFNIHLCAVFDGPAALKHWLTEDEAMKAFFQVHTSQKWYQRQDQERIAFLQSPAYVKLKQAVDELGVELQPSDPGEVYHVELVSKDAKQRLSAWPNNPPTALVCIKTREQLRWYVPITADSSLEGGQVQNRCHQFRYMFRGAVQKMRHLSAMGYRPAVIWMSEWNNLETDEQRSEYLKSALGAPDRRSTAFSPATAEVEEAYL